MGFSQKKTGYYPAFQFIAQQATQLPIFGYLYFPFLYFPIFRLSAHAPAH
jgi:hypothetical protein